MSTPLPWPARTAGRYALLGAALAFAPAAIVQAQPQAASAQQTLRFDIPAQSLASALSSFASQTGQELFYLPDMARGKQSPGVSGQLDIEQALARLLAGSELEFERAPTGALLIGDPAALEALRRDLQSRQGAAAPAGGVPSLDAARRGGIEEVIVTGQKRAERLQDVPIAISAFSMEDLDVQKIEGGFDLLKAIPNVSFSKTNFTGYNFQIRGVGTQSISATSDPGVAISFNGTAIIQNRLFEQEYLDVERVEVLRGPQGTLYGRNSTGGVVNVISAQPDLHEFSTTLKSEVGNYNSRRGSAIVNLPLIDGKLGLRIAGAFTNREGYDYNSITGNQVNGRDMWTGRLSLGFQPTDWFRGNLVYERFSENDNRSRTGKQLCHRDDGPAYVGSQPTSDPNFPRWDIMLPAVFSTGCKAGSLYDDAAFGTPNGLAINFVLGMLALSDTFHIGFDENGETTAPIRFQDPYGGQMQSRNLREIASMRDPVYRAEADLLTLNLDFELGHGLSLHSQTAYVDDQTYSFQDYNRFNTVPIFSDTSSLTLRERGPDDLPGHPPTLVVPSPFRHMAPGGVFCDPQLGCSNTLAGFDIARASAEQFSQELRLQSAWDGPFNFSIGANYTKFDVLADYYVLYNLLTAYAMMPPFNAGVLGDISQCYGSGFTGEGPPVPSDAFNSACPYIDPNPVESMDGNGHNYFRSKNPYKLDSYAVFGEAYYQFTDTVKLTAGLRYTRDEKRFTPVPSQVLLAPTTLAGGYVSHGYPALDDIVQKWGEVTGRLGVDWKVDTSFTDETLLYAFFSRGYKGGGANPPSPGFAVWDDLLARNVITDAERNIYQNFLAGGADGFLVMNAVEYGPTFEPEFVNAFEIGAKNTLFGGAMMLNATAFYYDYKDYQVSQIRDRTAVNENFDAKVWGAELEAVFAPTVDFQMVANVGYLRTRVADGETSIDIMNRTQGNPDYIVVKPWVQLPSNCVVPTAVAEHRLATVGAIQYFRLCGGYTGLGPARAIDPATGNAYDPADYPLLNDGAGLHADLGGKELPNSPRITANLGAQYGMDLFQGEWRATVRGDIYWQAKSFHRVYNYEPYDRLKSWKNVNLGLRFENPRNALTMELYVKNVLNDTPITGAFLNSDDTGLTTNVFTLDPRLVGFSITKGF